MAWIYTWNLLGNDKWHGLKPGIGCNKLKLLPSPSLAHPINDDHEVFLLVVQTSLQVYSGNFSGQDYVTFYERR